MTGVKDRNSEQDVMGTVSEVCVGVVISRGARSAKISPLRWHEDRAAAELRQPLAPFPLPVRTQ